MGESWLAGLCEGEGVKFEGASVEKEVSNVVKEITSSPSGPDLQPCCDEAALSPGGYLAAPARRGYACAHCEDGEGTSNVTSLPVWKVRKTM